jgi:hypothetical protein
MRDCCLRGKLEEKERENAVLHGLKVQNEGMRDCCLKGKLEEKERVYVVLV